MNMIIVLFLECELGVADASEGVDLAIEREVGGLQESISRWPDGKGRSLLGG